MLSNFLDTYWILYLLLNRKRGILFSTSSWMTLGILSMHTRLFNVFCVLTWDTKAGFCAVNLAMNHYLGLVLCGYVRYFRERSHSCSDRWRVSLYMLWCKARAKLNSMIWMGLWCQHLLLKKSMDLYVSLQMQLYLWDPAGLGVGFSEKSTAFQWELCAKFP